MLVNVKNVIKTNNEKINALVASGIKQRISDSKKYVALNGMLNTLLENGINTIAVDNSVAKNVAYNIGTISENLLRYAVLNGRENDMVKSLDKGVDGYTENGVPVEFKSLMVSASAEIVLANNLYILVYKEANKGKKAYKGVYKISAKTIRENNLIGKRIGSVDIIENYATYLKGASKKLGL